MKTILIFLFLIVHQILLSQVDLQTVSIYPQNDTIFGIDVSHYQGKIDFIKIDSSIKFVIIKVSEGNKIIDSKFDHNWNSCSLIKGGYHFFRPQISGKSQALLYLSKIKLDSGNIRPIIDVEHTRFWNKKRNRLVGIKNLKEMIEVIKDSTCLEPIIYTGGFFWDHYILPYYKDKHTFWVADYRKKKLPKVPKDSDYVIWQYTCRGKVNGIKGRVDKNMCINLREILIY
jgi:lysozyme